MADASLKGALLVASPALPDPNFDRTVVLVLASEQDGALGLVLNRPTAMDVSSPLPRWHQFAAFPPVVFVGGPVQPSAAICLARRAGAREDETSGWTPLVDDLGTLDLEQDPEALGIEVDAIRVFAGYAGWGAGQLEREIEAGAWFVLRSQPEDALSEEPRELWKRVLRRQGGSLALVAAYPPDPDLN